MEHSNPHPTRPTKILPRMWGRIEMGVLLALLPFVVTAQTDTLVVQRHHQTRHSTMFGGGWANTYDTYLSPLEYTGVDVAFMHETERRTRWKHISTQGLWRGHVSSTQNPVKNRDEYGGRIGYQRLWHYNPTPALPSWDGAMGFSWRVGGGVAGDIGGLYNTHSGNNPAQAYVNVSFVASVAADYTFNVPWWGHWPWSKSKSASKSKSRSKLFTIRAQLDAPFMGLMFAPNYGQSYYNIFSQGNYDHNVVATTPFNAPTLRCHVTLEVPVSSHTLRIGYMFDAIQAMPNNLRQHTYLNNIMIGWSKRIVLRPTPALPTGGGRK